MAEFLKKGKTIQGARPLETGHRAVADRFTCSATCSAGRQRVVNNFSWTITAEQTVEHYRALLEETNR